MKGGLVRGGGKMKGGVAQEEFSLLQRRVDRMEHSIGTILIFNLCVACLLV